MVILEANGCIPKVNGAPINCMECVELFVNITISRLVSIAFTNCEPVPMRKSPAVLVAVGSQSSTFSWSENRISRGSCVELPTGFVPNAITCLSTSDTNICFAIIGVWLAPPIVPISRALVEKPSPLIQ